MVCRDDGYLPDNVWTTIPQDRAQLFDVTDECGTLTPIKALGILTITLGN